VFFVGAVSSGKTLLSLRIIGALVGGSADASDFVTRGSEFNKNLCEKALWRIDDGEVASDPRSHAKFAEMVKKLAANPTLNYRAMFRDSVNNEWAGRLAVTLNDDSYSLQMIPDLTMSIEDKVMIYKVADVQRRFPPRHILEPMIAAELPHFARWLLEWTPPKELMVGGRFGVKSYIHSGLRDAALHAGPAGDLLELVRSWAQRANLCEKFKNKVWRGSPSEWHAAASQDDALKTLVTKFALRGLTRKFNEASRITGSPVRDLGDGIYEISLEGCGSSESNSREAFDPSAQPQAALR
jgi:hypothetical protein